MPSVGGEGNDEWMLMGIIGMSILWGVLLELDNDNDNDCIYLWIYWKITELCTLKCWISLYVNFILKNPENIYIYI